MSKFWYALRSKSRKEDIVWRQVVTEGFEAYYPRLRVQPVNPRARKLHPYFPGYLFVRADLEAIGLSVFQWMPHTLGLVNFGGEPAVVPENLIHSIRKRLDEINAMGGEVLESIRPGDVIWIREGPFKGYEAIFDARISGSLRVQVLLELLGNQRQVRVEMDASHIQPIK